MSETTSATADPVAKVGAEIDNFMPLLAMISALAKTYAGNIYRRIAGTVTNVASWDASHPEVQAAVSMMAPMISAVVPASSATVGTVLNVANLGQHVLGELGALMATDPTVQGPMPAPSVTTPTPAPTAG